MPEFKFIQNNLTKKWVILAPRRSKRPDEAKSPQQVCPFCPGQEKNEKEVYRVGGEPNDSNWQIRVLPNKYPFAPIHEIIIHSPDHHKNFGELDLFTAELIFKTFQQRFQTHKDRGQVYVFHNRGETAGESLVHPHSQLVVIPQEITLEIQPPQQIDQNTQEVIQTTNFYIFCPETSEWPDEVWIVPKSETFGQITDEEITDLSKIITKLVQIFELRHGKEFPYNFYIYPGKDWPASNASQSDAGWYLRFIPRVRTLGGFEIGTNVFVNTQDPAETLQFLKENFR